MIHADDNGGWRKDYSNLNTSTIVFRLYFCDSLKKNKRFDQSAVINTTALNPPLIKAKGIYSQPYNHRPC